MIHDDYDFDPGDFDYDYDPGDPADYDGPPLLAIVLYAVIVFVLMIDSMVRG